MNYRVYIRRVKPFSENQAYWSLDSGRRRRLKTEVKEYKEDWKEYLGEVDSSLGGKLHGKFFSFSLAILLPDEDLFFKNKRTLKQVDIYNFVKVTCDAVFSYLNPDFPDNDRPIDELVVSGSVSKRLSPDEHWYTVVIVGFAEEIPTDLLPSCPVDWKLVQSMIEEKKFDAPKRCSSKKKACKTR